MNTKSPFIFPGLCLLLSAFGLATLRADCLPAPSGLVAWWRAENDALDSIAANHGTLRNGATFATGKAGQGFSFDGVNDYVDVGGGFNLDDLTLEAWVLINPATNTGERRVLSKDNVGLSGMRKLMTLKSSAVGSSGNQGRAAFGVVIGGAEDALEAPFALTAGWHHLAGIRDADLNRFELYVDGVMVANKSTNAVTGPIDSVVNTVIGQVSPFFNGEFFAGLIDEPAIYNRALSAAEIQGIFNAGSAGKCAAPTLQIRALPGAVQLSWTTNATGYVLQTNSALTFPAGWGLLTSNFNVLSTNYVVTNIVGGAAKFYRLHKP
ncbi:MAG: LamG domain-containing protein [Akkermansiaceae bacterium]|nr:LamG domain-containing protein [Verrucomicrobiales bacterium]